MEIRSAWQLKMLWVHQPHLIVWFQNIFIPTPRRVNENSKGGRGPPKRIKILSSSLACFNCSRDSLFQLFRQFGCSKKSSAWDKMKKRGARGSKRMPVGKLNKRSFHLLVDHQQGPVTSSSSSSRVFFHFLSLPFSFNFSACCTLTNSTPERGYSLDGFWDQLRAVFVEIIN